MPSSNNSESRVATIAAQPKRKPKRFMTAAQKEAWTKAAKQHHVVLKRHVKEVFKRRASKD